ncbi:MAG: CPBP family intramembrane metalloprotease [Bacteroidia bacterium]|nr:CPBP family intramembrane metalloprotease [Bacteroidia bacterium]MCX7652884.1 CPBP family intramembrane metalloprotease [Bacteroidia bacterium]MDW8416648.1 CPBP family intramembrane glutamic endopeptidase [Bacteroidia bacterium]
MGLLIGYEGILRLVGSPPTERNLVDQWMTRLLGWATPYEWVISVGIVMVGLAYVYGIRREKANLTEWVFILMIAEAAVWGMLLYKGLPLLVANLRTAYPAQLAWLTPDFWQGIGQCMGAGFYEELFFRVLLVEMLLVLFTGLRTQKATAFHQVAAWVLSAALFSTAHFLYETPTTYAFLYRLIFGLFMSGIYMLRSFGITAWTHALYDIYTVI